MDATHYWPFAREYSIWNTEVTALQFRMADLEHQNLSNAIKWVYTAFFCSTSQQLRNSSEEVLSSHFMTTLNHTLEQELALEDESYNSGSESSNICTHLCRTPQVYHISMGKNLSFRPATPLTHHSHHLKIAVSAPYTATCHSVTAHQQIPVHSMVGQSILHLQDNKWLDTSLMTLSWISLVKKKKRKKNTSQQLHWMMTFGWMTQYQTGTYASMNNHNHMTCALTLAHTAWNMHQHINTWISATSVTFSMWQQPPAMKIYLTWRMFLNSEYRQ